MLNMKPYSTSQVAKLVRVTRVTLQNWMRGKKIPTPRVQRVAGVLVRFWNAKDIAQVRKYKAAHYKKGRGRKKKAKA